MICSFNLNRTTACLAVRIAADGRAAEDPRRHGKIKARDVRVGRVAGLQGFAHPFRDVRADRAMCAGAISSTLSMKPERYRT
jgi:hypothetical protein